MGVPRVWKRSPRRSLNTMSPLCRMPVALCLSRIALPCLMSLSAGPQSGPLLSSPLPTIPHTCVRVERHPPLSETPLKTLCERAGEQGMTEDETGRGRH